MKNQCSKCMVLLSILALFSTFAFGQSSGWTLLKDSAGVKVSYQIQSCSGQDWVMLKAENQTSENLTVTWDDVLSSGTAIFNSAQLTTGYIRSIQLNGQSTRSGGCSTLQEPNRLQLPLLLFLNGQHSLNNLTVQLANFTIVKN